MKFTNRSNLCSPSPLKGQRGSEGSCEKIEISVSSGTKRAQGDGGRRRPLHPGGTRAPRAFSAVDSESPGGSVSTHSISSQLQGEGLR
jgi:hypothetical protein